MILEELNKLKEYTEMKKLKLEEESDFTGHKIIKILEKEYGVNHDKIFGFKPSEKEIKYTTGFEEFKRTGKINLEKECI